MLSIKAFPWGLVCALFSGVPVMADAALPEVPRGVAMTANSPESITLSWYRPKQENVTSYNVYSSPTKEGTYNRVATVSDRTVTLNKLTPASSYFYKVSATNAAGESPQSSPAPGFTTIHSAGAPFPVRIAKNMCVTLGATIVSSPAPTQGQLTNFVDGSDATSAAIEGPCEVKIKLNTAPSIQDAEYLLLNFRTDSTGKSYAYNINWRSLKNYTITESDDSTNGTDGTWREVLTGTNEFLDGVVVIPSHKPKWIGIKNSGSLQLCRLDIFRSAPAGYRNDSWIFTGDSLVVQDLAGGFPDRFSDLVRQRYPDRYPIVVQAAQGGEMMANTFGRMKKTLAALSPPNGTANATGTIVCWESGFNDIGLGGGLWQGKKVIQNLTEARDLCAANGLILVPVRIEFATAYLDKTTLEPAQDNIFHNSLGVNLAGVDQFCRQETPYALDPQTQLPYADYWTYTRQHHDTAIGKDGVHHTKEGSDGINRLWADVAGKMIYSRQP